MLEHPEEEIEGVTGRTPDPFPYFFIPRTRGRNSRYSSPTCNGTVTFTSTFLFAPRIAVHAIGPYTRLGLIMPLPHS